jgi:hypothetical protein
LPFSELANWMAVASATTEIFSDVLPSARFNLPRSRTSLAPTMMLVCTKPLKPLAWIETE